MPNLARETGGEVEQASYQRKTRAACTDPAVGGITDPVSLSDLPSTFFYYCCVYDRKQTRP